MNTDDTYKSLLSKILSDGDDVYTRDKHTREIIGNRIVVNINQPILQMRSTRNCNYAFMAAEAHWILTGSSELIELARYNKRMAEFSDDGKHLQGAYGPRYVNQLMYCLMKLIEDVDTRQSVMTFWQQNPRNSRDIPCTVMAQFLIREGELHMCVAMRSSDVWLGLPYDIFSFSMMVVYLHCGLRKMYPDLQLGKLTIFAGSQHLYAEHFERAKSVISDVTLGDIYVIGQYDYLTTDDLMNDLSHAKDYKINPIRHNEKIHIHNYFAKSNRY